MNQSSHTRELADAFPVRDSDVARYRRDGFVVLRNVLSAELLGSHRRRLDQILEPARADQPPLRDRDTYGKAFLQVTNLWTRCETVRELVFSRRLARIAGELMGVPGVRLYHDQALYKEAGGGPTPWHRDRFYWPLATDCTCTAWIPLQDTPLQMGPAAFAAGSQDTGYGGDLEIGDESEERIGDFVRDRGFQVVAEPFRLGDVSFHSGGTIHRSGANTTASTRRAMAVIYMDRDAVMASPANRFQEADRAAWLPGCVPGGPVDSPLSPVLWEA